MKNYILCCLLFVCSLSAIGLPKGDSTKVIQAYKLIEPFVLDGELTESAYKNPPISNFTQKDPDEGQPATEKSNMWIFYDESNIYFCGQFFDSQPDSIDLTLMRRDNVVESDWLWIYLDPYNDDRTGFYFAVNPRGSICDGTLYNDGWMSDSWDGIWENKTSVDENGWNAEVKIPFTQLRFKEAEKMVWGVNLNRDVKRKHEMSFYVMIPKNESGFVSKFADLIGLDGIKPKQRIEILPYLVQRAQYLRHDNGDPFYKGNQYQTALGADLKFSLGSNFNVDATINPDFGQVEVDPAIVNLSAFENFYDEKRPFFIEGANTFQFGYGGSNNNWGFNFSNPTLFYSRRIGRSPQRSLDDDAFIDSPSETRLLAAAKLSGKFDESWSIGVLSAFTERTFANLYSDSAGRYEREVEPFTHYGVFRTQKQFNDGMQALGIMFTSVNRDLGNPALKEILSENAFTFGLDGWTYLDKDETYVITGSVIGSYTHGTKDYITKLQKRPYRYFQRPDKTFMPLDSNRTSLSGIFSRLMLNKQKGNFYLNAAIGTASPGFEYNDLGSQWFADRINGHIVLGYRWFEPDKIFRNKNIYFAFNRTSDYEDNISRIGFYTSGSVQFQNWWRLQASSDYTFETTSTTLTRGGPKVSIPTNYSINISGFTDSREKIIFSPFGGFWRNDAGSNEYYYGFNLEWKPSSQIGLTIGPEYSFNNSNYQWVDNFSDQEATQTYNERYVFGTLDQKTISANIRLNWIFNPNISLQLYVQPLISVGNYEGFKELARPNSLEFNVYGKDGSQINYNDENDEYLVDPDGDGPAEQFDFSNPDFNFKSFIANLVLRWEILPGSVFYFVWSHNKTNEDDPGNFSLRRDLRNLWKAEADNVLLIKFSYWLNM
ncbi:DUF5916 domain-containing protein [Bacteroidota bacterium]